MKELMIHVERAVRPLRITQGQRGAIREELLSHLQGIYDEEFTRCGDRTEALESALKRFGPAEEVSQNLRGAMPWYSAALSTVPWFTPVRSWPETNAKIAWRGWMTAILLWVFIGIPWCGVMIVAGRMSELQAIAWWFLMASLGVAMLVPAVGMIGSIFGAYGLTRSAGRAAVSGVAGCLAQLGIYALIKVYIRPELPVAVFVVPLLIPLTIIAASRTRTFAAFVQDDSARDERAGEWEQLVIDE